MTRKFSAADLLRDHDKRSREAIELEARAAAAGGQSIAEACAYPFGTAEAAHFTAAYLVALPLPRAGLEIAA